MGIFSFLKQKKYILEDYSFLGVDFHSHFIPGIDDGAATTMDSVNLIWQLKQLGFSKIVTTPHIMADGYKNSRENILPGMEAVKEALKKNNIDIPFSAAAEYFLDDGFLEKLENKEILAINDKYLLFELSYLNKSHNIDEMVFKMQSAGYTPILAHPERYPYFYDDKLTEYRHLVSLGVMLQVNIPSLAGAYGPGPRDFGRKLLDAQLADFLATDLHNQHQLKYLEKALSDKWIFKAAESGVLKNKHLF